MTNPIPIEKLREVVKVCEKAAPGPYDLIVDSCRACIQDGKEGEYLIEHHVSIAERNANAHLFCAAPDLLEALKLYVAYRYSGEGGSASKKARQMRAEMNDAIEKAIAKAEGKPCR